MRTGFPPIDDAGREWALVDVETSGLRPHRDRVLSVAVLTVDAAGHGTGEYSTLLDPGCDPGPVHIHGLTTERLRGAPTFEQVAPVLGGLLAGRILVAHNAPFDYGFLAQEFARARSHLPVATRLCTLALNRLLQPPTPDLKLATLARHYGVHQTRAHDALDDTRVLAGVFRGSLAAARDAAVELPFVACPPRQEAGRFPPTPPKTPCPYRNPGRFEGTLRQGMKVVFSGESALSRAALVERAVAAGLNVMTSVSRQTSLLVAEVGTATSKAARARALRVPTVSEAEFLDLLGRVLPGTPVDVASFGGRPCDRSRERAR